MWTLPFCTDTWSGTGVDAESGLVHTVIGSAANVNDVTQAQGLLHGDETAGYQG